jgi:DNA-nicking Smr family endonuclease
MADVVPLVSDGKERVRPESPVSAQTTTGDTASSVPETDIEDVESTFVAPGVDRRELRRLKRGYYPVQKRVDLHGMTASQAVARVTHLIDDSRHSQHRCVSIVHGRGLHSDGNVSVLRGRVRELLRSHRAVLAYTDAPAADGGAGAVYVLLRT